MLGTMIELKVRASQVLKVLKNVTCRGGIKCVWKGGLCLCVYCIGVSICILHP